MVCVDWEREAVFRTPESVYTCEVLLPFELYVLMYFSDVDTCMNGSSEIRGKQVAAEFGVLQEH